jgi:hypothetical protein
MYGSLPDIVIILFFITPWFPCTDREHAADEERAGLKARMREELLNPFENSERRKE